MNLLSGRQSAVACGYMDILGLAKAAGDTTQAQSANTAGTYTPEAKTAIRTMLGIDTASLVAEIRDALNL